MKFFLDTAHLESLIQAKKTGLIEGVTTNPTHLSKEGSETTLLIKEIASRMYPYDVSVEVTKKASHELYKQAHEIAALAPNIVVKIPCHKDYLPIIHTLVQEGIALNITLIFSVTQGISMAKLNVKYVSPFIGRLEDTDTDGSSLIEDLRVIFDLWNWPTKILAASIRSPLHVHKAARAGADCITVPVSVFNELIDHPLTDKGIKLFDDDWKKLGITKFP